VYASTLREELESLGLWELLEDPALTDVVINADGVLHTFGYEGVHRREQPVPEGRLRSCLATIAGVHRRLIDERHPILEVSLPEHDVRVTALVPPVTTGPVLALRIPPRRLLSLEDLVELGSLEPDAREVLVGSLVAGETIVVAGAVSSGKTALASALLDHLLRACPEERLVVLEEGARELQLPDRSNVSRLLTSDGDGLCVSDLLRVSLRLNPDRIVLGELRGPEALDFVRAALSGHPGLATVHASTALGAVDRLTDLLEEAGAPPAPARVARAVDLVVHLRRSRARRFVDEIVRLGAPDRGGSFETEVAYRRLEGVVQKSETDDP
jgi:type IV secretion system protein VirB11